MRRAISLFLLTATFAAPIAGAAEPLGRLFFTPAQRSALDAGKRLATSPPPAAKRTAPRGPESATLSGVVTRSDGEYTVWVNGRAVGKGGPPGVSAVPSASHPAAARIKLRGANAPVELRVGQRVERSAGRVSEGFLRRQRSMPEPKAEQTGGGSTQ